MGNSSSIRSAAEGNGDHQLPQVSIGDDWADDAKDQGWLDKPVQASHNGWGESSSNSIVSNGWMDKAVKGEYRGWSSEPAKQEFNGWVTEPVKDDYNGWGVPQPKRNATVANPDTQTQDPSSSQALYPCNSTAVNQVDGPIEGTQNGVTTQPCIRPNHNNSAFSPSAPPMPEEFLLEEVNSEVHEATLERGSSSCIICWESPVEGACVPCGHMAGCMSCLYEIKSKKGDCPICRVKIDQVIKLYAV